MTGKRVPENGYYVYALYREDGVTPFYIGKGGLNRWHYHERHAHRSLDHKDRIILRMRAAGITEIPKKKLAEGLTDTEAKAMEIDLIAAIGREPDGPLVNGTSGGDGICQLSEEAMERKRASQVAAFAKPEIKAKLLVGLAQRSLDPEYGRKLGAAISAACQRPEVFQRRSVGLKKAWERDHEWRVERLTERNKSAIVRQKKSVAMKAVWAGPNATEHFGCHTPEALAKASIARTEAYKNPEVVAKLSANGKRGADIRWERYRAARQNDVPSGNDTESHNPHK